MDYISENYASGNKRSQDNRDYNGGSNSGYASADPARNEPREPDLQTAIGSMDAEGFSSSPPLPPSFTLSSKSPLPNTPSASLPKFDMFAPPPKKKRRTGLIVALSLALILVIGLAGSAIYTLLNYGFPQPAATPSPSVTEGFFGSGNTFTPSPTPTYAAPEGESVTMTLEDIPTAAGARDDGGLSFADIYVKCIGSVVSITSSSSNAISMGTGIIMTEDGYILTNNHIISGGYSVSVTLQDGRQYTAAVVGADDINDLAVLKIDETGLSPAEFGNSDSLRVGDIVVAIGNPTTSEELRGTMTDGIISAINRNIEVDGRVMTLLQTNAALNSGNSGGPLINIYGQVIGINIMKFASTTTSFEGLGFAIPISVAKPIVDELIANGYIAGRPAIGIEAIDMSMAAAAYYRVPQGILVNSIDERSQAASSGLRVGDIIVAINEVDVMTKAELYVIKNEYSVGDIITITVYREEEYLDFQIELMDESVFRSNS